MDDDPLEVAVAALRREIAQVDDAMVRLDARRQRLEDAVRLIQSHQITTEKPSPRSVSSNVVEMPLREPNSRESGATRLVRKIISSSPGPHTTSSIKKATGLKSQQVANALTHLLDRSEVSRVPVESLPPGLATRDDTRSRWAYYAQRWAYHADGSHPNEEPEDDAQAQ